MQTTLTTPADVTPENTAPTVHVRKGLSIGTKVKDSFYLVQIGKINFGKKPILKA